MPARQPDVILREIIGDLAIKFAMAQSNAELLAEELAKFQAEKKDSAK